MKPITKILKLINRNKFNKFSLIKLKFINLNLQQRLFVEPKDTLISINNPLIKTSINKINL